MTWWAWALIAWAALCVLALFAWAALVPKMSDEERAIEDREQLRYLDERRRR